jgi:hypothetical protein
VYRWEGNKADAGSMTIHASGLPSSRRANSSRPRAARNTAVEQAVEAFNGVAGAATALLILAGEDALTDRTRPSLRRSGVTQTEEDATPVEPPAG